MASASLQSPCARGDGLAGDVRQLVEDLHGA